MAFLHVKSPNGTVTDVDLSKVISAYTAITDAEIGTAWSNIPPDSGVTYAPLDSPVFSGTPSAPTPTSLDNSTKIATTEFVKNVTGTFLSLTGGTMTGDIKSDTDDFSLYHDGETYSEATTSTTKIYSGATTGSSYLELTKAATEGSFKVSALGEESDEYSLEGNTDGELNWAGEKITFAENKANINFDSASNTLNISIAEDAIGTNQQNFIFDLNGRLKLTRGVFFDGVNNETAYLAISSEKNNFNFGYNYDARDGAFINLRSKSSTDSGCFFIHARNTANSFSLAGTPGGNLTWGGNAILHKGTSGLYYSQTATNISFTSTGTGKNMVSVSVPAGRYLVIGKMYTSVSNLTTGKVYGCQVTATSAQFSYGNGFSTYYTPSANGVCNQAIGIITLTAAGTLYCVGYVGATCTISNAGIYALRMY